MKAGEGETVKILYVCQRHYVQLVVKQKVADYVPEHFEKCWMYGCGLPSFRRVLLRDPSGMITKDAQIMPDGTLWEEIGERVRN